MNQSKSNKIPVDYDNVCNFNVIINIVRATGIPVRDFGISDRRASSVSMHYQGIFNKY